MRPTSVISGQWEPGLVLHACPIIEEGRYLLGLIDKQTITVINAEDEGGSAGVAGSHHPTDDNEELPQEELDGIEAREFGEKWCEKTASEWAEAQMKDESARIAIEFLHSGVPVGEITEGTILDVVRRDIGITRLVSQGKLKELSNTRKLLMRRLTLEPAHRDDRNPGRFERLLGDEPVRTYVPLLLRPWVMDCTHKEAVHLGEKVTLNMLKRYYWWIGMAEC